MNVIWNQTTDTRKAVIVASGDMFKYEVYELWSGRYGAKVAGPLLYSGYRETLPQAKQSVFQLV